MHDDEYSKSDLRIGLFQTVVYSFSPKQRLRFLDVNEKIEMAEYFQIEPRSVRMVQTLY